MRNVRETKKLSRRKKQFSTWQGEGKEIACVVAFLLVVGLSAVMAWKIFCTEATNVLAGSSSLTNTSSEETTPTSGVSLMLGSVFEPDESEGAATSSDVFLTFLDKWGVEIVSTTNNQAKGTEVVQGATLSSEDCETSTAEEHMVYLEQELGVFCAEEVWLSWKNGLVGYASDMSSTEGFSQIETQLLQQGWVCVPSENDNFATFTKGQGDFQWLCVACVDNGSGCSVVVQFVTPKEV